MCIDVDVGSSQKMNQPRGTFAFSALFVIGTLLALPSAEGDEPAATGPLSPPLARAPEETTSTPLDQGDQVPLTLRKIVVRGNEAISQEELDEALSPFVGTPIPASSLPDIAQAVTVYYRKRGYFLARTALPAQKIREGIVEIHVLEGKLGAIQVEGNLHFSTATLQAQLSAMRQHAAIREDMLESALLRLNDYPDLDARAVFKTGRTPGTADLHLLVEEKQPVHLDLQYNNFGSRLSGRNRFAMSLSHGSLWNAGHAASFRAIANEEDYALFSIDYDLPVGGYGTRAGLSARRADLELGGDLEILEIKSRATSAGPRLTHPLYRTRQARLDLEAGFLFKNVKSELLRETLGHDELRIAQVGTRAEAADRLRGKNFLSVEASMGIPDFLGGSDERDPEASRAGAGGKFLRWNFEIGRIQQVLADTYLVLRGSAQVSRDDLPLSEQFAIGGADSVRGYPPAEFLGDAGHAATFELRTALPFLGDLDVTSSGPDRTLRRALQLVAFVDAGMTRLESPLTGQDRVEHLLGAGLGVRLKLPYHLEVRFDWGTPIGKDPSDGADSRGYISLTKRVF